MKNSFIEFCAKEDDEKLIERKMPLYDRASEVRSTFFRDYTRVLHSNAYRRLKSKTQVFFSPQSDHICTRSEHVNLVESISYSIAKYFGLNTELTRAISIAHDIGHSPFGHQGEKILSEISKRDINETFWHEKNGLYLVDNIELLEDNKKIKQNLNLTYAVRDGIISHCGEIDENSLIPRKERIDLAEYDFPNKYLPYTWEGCVVKIADKISYLGRDLEDAISLKIVDDKLEDLYDILNLTIKNDVINNTVIINTLTYDLCQNSSPDKGLTFSPEVFSLINKLKKYNYENIYLSERLSPSNRYFKIVLNEIYDTLINVFDADNTMNVIDKKIYTNPEIFLNFKEWLSNYTINRKDSSLNNKILYDISKREDFSKAVITYISGMTDNFAIDMYNKIIRF